MKLIPQIQITQTRTNLKQYVFQIDYTGNRIFFLIRGKRLDKLLDAYRRWWTLAASEESTFASSVYILQVRGKNERDLRMSGIKDLGTG